MVGDRPLGATLYLASGTGGVSNERAVTDFHAYIATRNYPGLSIVFKKFDAGHTAMDIPAFEDVIDRFLE
ncbi:hypothetical protein [Xenophilus sp.]|uniref:hypothetical protein n=1 Tax=Xenophilus sp. TaxID=1873499 RepID=UPI0037DC3D63